MNTELSLLQQLTRAPAKYQVQGTHTGKGGRSSGAMWDTKERGHRHVLSIMTCLPHDKPGAR